MTNITQVAVAVIVNDKNEVCISLRHKKVHQGGLWEFPGGKIELNETVEQALVREIKEELNLDILKSRPLITITHEYADKKVCLHVNKVLDFKGDAIGAEGQTVQWVPVSKLMNFEFPQANKAIIKALNLPDRYLITGKFLNTEDYLSKLKKALSNNIKLVQLRLKDNSCNNQQQLETILMQTSHLCRQYDAKLMLNLSIKNLEPLNLSEYKFDGYHLDSQKLKAAFTSSTFTLPAGKLLSASCHNSEELTYAAQLKADFVVLSPVQKTASHPEMATMGWQTFSEKVKHINAPVYALGGVGESDIGTAWRYGGQGVAAISAFWM